VKHFQIEMIRIENAQVMMHQVNQAIAQGEIKVLKAYGLSAAHIEQLVKRHAQGKPPYPAYLFRHNAETLQYLRRAG
jgi:O-acetyl-ADP-ribose deacetylase (regulator of RNase III)